MAERVVRDPNAICSHCWLCRNVCPAYKILKDEIFTINLCLLELANIEL